MSTVSSLTPVNLSNNLNGGSPSPSFTTNSTNINKPMASDNLNSENKTSSSGIRRNFPTDANVQAEDVIIPLMVSDSVMGPPLANPEDDDSADDREVVNRPYPGVDDGFFFNRANEDGPTFPDPSGNAPNNTDDIDGVRRPFPGRGPLSPSIPGTNKSVFDMDIGGVTDFDSIPDVNVYQHKKTLAQGMMDLALFSANANQLRYVLENSAHPYFYPGVVLISISLLLQVAIGVGLIWNSRYNVKDEKEICIANKINNFTIIGIFLVTVVNVFISAFGVASSPAPAASSSASVSAASSP